jgi:magnesium chelatase family protein
VTIQRAAGSATFPCRAQPVLAANPCPCPSAAGDTACTCSPLERRRYQSRLSGPLLDRTDLWVDLPPVTRAAWLDGLGTPEPTASVAVRVRAARVRAARAAAAQRLTGTGLVVNSQVPGRLLRERWAVPRASRGWPSGRWNAAPCRCGDSTVCSRCRGSSRS